MEQDYDHLLLINVQQLVLQPTDISIVLRLENLLSLYRTCTAAQRSDQHPGDHDSTGLYGVQVR